MQIPSWYQRESTGDDDGSEVQGDHASAVSFHITTPDGDVSSRHTVNREEAEKVDPAKVIEQPRTYLGLHEQGDGGGEKHQDHVRFTQTFVQRRSFSDQQQHRAEHKARDDRSQVDVHKVGVGHSPKFMKCPQLLSLEKVSFEQSCFGYICSPFMKNQG